jgi:hypothetical protein
MKSGARDGINQTDPEPSVDGFRLVKDDGSVDSVHSQLLRALKKIVRQ